MTYLLSPLFFLLVSIALHATNPTDLQIRVPQTQSAVMLDGVLSVREWHDAQRVTVPGTAELYFQRSSDFVYIAVRYTASPSGIVDLYVSPRADQIYDLHASAKLGERQLQSKGFPDWVWWNNHDWIANVSRVDSFEKHTFLPTPVREYQIRRLRFPSSIWRVRFELTAMDLNNETRSQTIFPSGTSQSSTKGWLVLSLD